MGKTDGRYFFGVFGIFIDFFLFLMTVYDL